MYSLVRSQSATADTFTRLAAAFSVCDLTRHNGLVTQQMPFQLTFSQFLLWQKVWTKAKLPFQPNLMLDKLTPDLPVGYLKSEVFCA